MCVCAIQTCNRKTANRETVRSILNLSYKGDMGITWNNFYTNQLQPLPDFYQGSGQGTFRGCDIDLRFLRVKKTETKNRLLWQIADCLVVVLPTPSGNIFVGKFPHLGYASFTKVDTSLSKILSKMQMMQMTVKICLKWGSFSKRESSQCTWLHITWS